MTAPELRPPQPPQDPTDIARVIKFIREEEQKVARSEKEKHKVTIMFLLCLTLILSMHYFWNQFMVDGVVKPLKGIDHMLQHIDDKLVTLERSSFYP